MRTLTHIRFRHLLTAIALFNTIFISRATTSLSTGPRITALNRIPLSFEMNQGQAGSDVRFLSRVGNYFLFLMPDGAKLVPNTTDTATTDGVVSMTLLGGNAHVQISGIDPLEGRTNYFLGRDPQDWRTDIPTFARVQYQDVYPKIDMVYHGNEGSLQYDFIVSPGADASTIRLGFEGARRCFIDARGDVILQTRLSTVRFRKPVSYQEVDGKRNEISSAFVLKGKNEIGFNLGKYDRSKRVIIDPTLVYSTYLGGSISQSGQAIAVDVLGNVYVTGETRSANFPTTPGAFGSTSVDNYAVAFVSKFNASGSALLYSAFIGGVAPPSFYSGFLATTAYSIAVDREGNAYLTGQTQAADFPTTAGAYQPALATGSGVNAFVTKLNANGSALVYSTLLGGMSEDVGRSIAVDGAGSAYVTGSTQSVDFPYTLGAFQKALRNVFGSSIVADAFVTKLNPSGSALVYSTFLGGTNSDSGEGIGLDGNGSAFVIGTTQSTNFPITPDTYQIVLGGSEDAFVTKLSVDGSSLVYSTYLGDTNVDTGRAIAVDANGNAYASGFAGSTYFPTTPGAYKRVRSEGGDGFVAKFSTTGKDLVYSTFVGIGGVVSIGLDPLENSYVVGGMGSVLSLDRTASIRRYVTTLPGGTTDVAVDGIGNAYVTGSTSSASFPVTPGAFQTSRGAQGTYSVGADAFVAKISPDASAPEVTALSPTSIRAGSSAIYPTLTVTGRNFEPTSVVQWNEQDRETKFVSIGTLTASIPSTDLTTAGTAQVRVKTPGVGMSAPLAFTIEPPPPNPQPFLGFLFPASIGAITSGAGFVNLTVSGSGFVPSSIVQWNGQDRSTHYSGNPTRLDASIPFSDLSQVGEASVTVFNPAPGGGTSFGLVFRITERVPPPPPPTVPAPAITSLQPSTTVAGASSFSFTVFGQNFVSGRSFVQWNGLSQPTSFASTTQLRAFMSDVDIASEGTVQISVINTAPGGGISESLPFTITPRPPNPRPTLTSLYSPSKSRRAGDTGFTLRVTGRDFMTGSVLRWNGQDRPTTSLNFGQIDGSISAEDIRNAGIASVSVWNPAPGGGSSFSVPFPVYSETVLQIETNDIIYDPSTRKIYASRPAIARSNRNSITTVDPERGVIESSIALSSEPGKLAISDDGKYLYAAVSGGIQRIDLSTQKLDLQFSLGPAQYPASRIAVDMEVVPGNPRALAVVAKSIGASRDSPGEVLIFDDGVKRSKSVSGISVIEFGSSSTPFASSSTLYGCSLGYSNSAFYTMTVDASGLSVVNSTNNLCFADIKLEGGLIYDMNGRVFHPQARQRVGTYEISFTRTGTPIAFKPDSRLGRTFFLTSGSGGYKELLIFDQASFGLVGSIDLPSGFSGTSLTRFGEDGLAFRTNEYSLYLLRVPPEWLKPAQTTQFAQIGTGAGFVSSVLVTNPSSSAVATGSVNFFNDQGVPFGSFGDPLSNVSFSVPPLGLFRYSTPANTTPLQVGSARVVTNSASSGVVKFGAPDLGLAGVGESVPAQSLILPVVRNSTSKLNTGVALANSRAESAEVLISLRGLDGTPVGDGTTSITLPPNGHIARYIHELFPGIDTSNFLGTLTATTTAENGRIAATAIQLGTVAGEFTTLPVVPVEPAPPAREVSFPQFADGDGYSSSFFLTNPSRTKAVSGLIRFYDDNGIRIAVPMEGGLSSSEVPFAVAPLGGVVLTTAAGAKLVSGSARVIADGPVGGVLRFNFPALGLAGVGASDSASGFLIPASRNASRNISTGVAVASAGSAVNLVFTLRGPAGDPISGGQAILALPANGHIARFIQELFPSVDTSEFEGTVIVTAGGGTITATAIEIGSKPGEFTTLPASPLR